MSNTNTNSIFSNFSTEILPLLVSVFASLTVVITMTSALTATRKVREIREAQRLKEKIEKRSEKLQTNDLEVILNSLKIEVKDEEPQENLPSNVRNESGSLTDDWKEIILMARSRLLVEESRLVTSSYVNLIIGAAVSVFAAVYLAFLVFGGITRSDIGNETSYDWFGFISEYGPKFGLVILIQLIASFFLRNYHRAENFIQKNKNDVTNLELRLASGMMLEKDATILGPIAIKLAEEERNFVLEKKQKSALTNNDANPTKLVESIRALVKDIKP